ncbi:hypothetical protein [Roseomonas chloroacetimidivorans]|uniref:hypothetical protein n=1 Tax=Roseomonas chloroacetimidivorans TaxID=1766656 RepID=UPI003C74F27F
MVPKVTVFGSCRVHTPCTILQKDGKLKLNQKNIFGFTHYTSEILQQFDLICGARQAPARLRPYMNIGENWSAPPPADFSHFGEMFRETDLFVVEISSVRQVIFKSIFLQINRVMDQLVKNDAVLKRWWKPMLASGKNDLSAYPLETVTPVEAEVVRQIRIREQTPGQIVRDIGLILQKLGKPVLFVSHFNVQTNNKPVPQRQLIIDALRTFEEQPGVSIFDPTEAVVERGTEASLIDFGHYKHEFEPHVASLIWDKADTLLREVV